MCETMTTIILNNYIFKNIYIILRGDLKEAAKVIVY